MQCHLHNSAWVTEYTFQRSRKKAKGLCSLRCKLYGRKCVVTSKMAKGTSHIFPSVTDVIVHEELNKPWCDVPNKYIQFPCRDNMM